MTVALGRLGLIGIDEAGGTLGRFWQARIADSFRATRGEVIGTHDSGSYAESSGRRTSPLRGYRGEVHYTYSVDGVAHLGTRVIDEPDYVGAAGAVRNQLAAYVPGAPVDVLYDLHDPADSVLEPSDLPGYGPRFSLSSGSCSPRSSCYSCPACSRSESGCSRDPDLEYSMNDSPYLNRSRRGGTDGRSRPEGTGSAVAAGRGGMACNRAEPNGVTLATKASCSEPGAYQNPTVAA